METPIPDHAQKTIEDLKAKIAEIEATTAPLRASINAVLAAYGQPPEYDDHHQHSHKHSKPKTLSFRPDEFYGKPLATCVREVLQSRKLFGLGPAPSREIFDSLRTGGFLFDSSNEDTAFRSMQISIGKNTPTFVKLPSGLIGLVEWYDKTPRRKSAGKVSATSVVSAVENDWPNPGNGDLSAIAASGSDSGEQEEKE